MEKEGLAEFNVEILESCLVQPCLPDSPRSTLYLSNLDNQPAARVAVNMLLVYEGCANVLPDPAKTIRYALSKVLVYYYPLAGRLRKKEDGKFQVECTGEGVLFVETLVDKSLSILGDLEQLRPSFKQLVFRFPFDTAMEDVHPMVLQVNRFTCGGFVVGVTFYHILCDGRGLYERYEGCANVLSDPAKNILEALSKVLVYYYPLVGRLRKKEDGKFQAQCIGEGVLFVETLVDKSLSILGDLEQLRPSIKQLVFGFPFDTAMEDVHPMVL
ncbi:hypothetical protein SUGI_1202110 [Cryptomeria japonica]|nr:hypothetical protein SUGI_1202110 [Cryptomeria japonica]